MKITKQRLKEIIKEELENSQNEGLFGKLKAKLGFGSKKWKPLTDKFEKEQVRLRDSYYDMKTGAEVAEVVKAMVANFDQYMDALADEDLDKDQQRATDSVIRLYRSELENVADYAERKGAQDAKEAAERADALARKRAKEQADYEKRARRSRDAAAALRVANSGETRSSKKSDFDRFMQDDEPYNYMTRMEEGKITRGALKAIIAEELTKAEKARKKKLEKELDDLKHK